MSKKRIETTRREFVGLGVTLGAGAMFWPVISRVGYAQQSGVFCVPQLNKPLATLGEITPTGKVLKGLIDLGIDKRSITFYKANGGYICSNFTLRAYQGYQGWNVDPKKRVTLVGVASPGPVLRVPVGGSVQLIFLNRIDKSQFSNTSLTSIKSQPNKCDTAFNVQGGQAYPLNDAENFPNCFHASNTSNLHFHGTHTSPGGFGDNVLIGVLPDPAMDPNAAIAQAMKAYAEWDSGGNPSKWLIEATMTRLGELLDAAKQRNDQQLAQQIQDAIHTNHELLAAGEWPQYWAGLYPHQFDLPVWSGDLHKFPSMGQAPGTHWYHCHQHGSTSLQLLNGMAGVIIITGDYDDKMLRIGGGTPEKPKIKERVIIFQLFSDMVNQVNGGLQGGGSPTDPQIAVNGQIVPKVTLKRGEVEWWRIANAAMKAHGVGDFLFLDDATYQKLLKDPSLMTEQSGRYKGRSAAPPPIDPALVPTLNRTAQDGVQYAWDNFQRNLNLTGVQLAPGNRGDFLVKAPAKDGVAYLVFWPTQGGPPSIKDIRAATVMKVETSGAPDSGTNTSMPAKADYPELPGFLADIKDDELKGHARTLAFSMIGGPGSQPKFMIDGHQFQEGRIDQLVLEGDAEEWTLTNSSLNGIMHPFHIHINPFQVTEVYDPRTMKEPQKLPQPWVWGDVIAIPPAVQKLDDKGQPVFDASGNPVLDGGPGHIKVRSRFVDFPGTFVLHCHILGHEDRGMMQMVEVRSNKTVKKHH